MNPSVCPYVLTKQYENGHTLIYEKPSSYISFHVGRTMLTTTFREDLHVLLRTSRTQLHKYLLEPRMFCTKVIEPFKTHFMSTFFLKVLRLRDN
jgi:hypothetical protein